MKLYFPLFLLFVILVPFRSMAQQENEEAIKVIRHRFAEIENEKAYIQMTPHLADDTCRFTIEIKKKNNKIYKIELRRVENTRAYTYQYYYWDGELFFVYTRNDINEGENDKGIVTFRVFEYRHYFLGTRCIRSLYRGFRYTDKEPSVKNIEFMDCFKAYEERERGDKLLEYAEKNEWKSICQMHIPL